MQDIEIMRQFGTLGLAALALLGMGKFVRALIQDQLERSQELIHQQISRSEAQAEHVAQMTERCLLLVERNTQAMTEVAERLKPIGDGVEALLRAHHNPEGDARQREP